jgi:photosystem II stability/assembly factor-like uncharacterized protein
LSSASSSQAQANCTDLAEPYQWQKINPPGTSFAVAVEVDPHQPGGLWAGFKDNGIFRSDDCGTTWRSTNGNAGFAVPDASPVSLAVDPVNPGVLYVAMYLGPLSIWKSTDGGLSWQDLFPSGHPVRNATEYNWWQSVRLNPNDPNHVVASTHGQCYAPYDEACQIESLDAGATWKIVKNPLGGPWAENGGAVALASDLWLFSTPWGPMAGIWTSTDHGDNWVNVTPQGAGGMAGIWGTIPIPASDGNIYMPTENGMVRSKDGGFSWEHIPNLSGRFVSMVTIGDRFVVSDQWSNNYRIGNVNDLSQWTMLAPPEGMPADQGAVFLTYDADNRVLYSSNFTGGLWRMVLP